MISLSSWQGAWWYIGRHGAGEVVESYILIFREEEREAERVERGRERVEEGRERD